MRIVVLALVAVGCGGGGAVEGAAPGVSRSVAQGGSVVLDGDLVAYVADADNAAVHRVDLGTGAISTTEVGGAPEQVVLLGDGEVAVSVRDTNQVVVLRFDAAGEGAVTAAVDVPVDPYGLAVTPGGELLVTSAWGHALTALDAGTLGVRWSVDLGREPRAVVVTPDGARAFVTHLVGDAVSVVDLDRHEARRLRVLGGRYRNRVDRAAGAGTLHPTASLAYAAALSPSGTRLFVPHVALQNGSDTVRSIPGAYGGVPVEEDTTMASVAVLSARGEALVGDAAASGDGGPLERTALIAADPSVGFAVAPASAPSRQARAAVVIGDGLFVVSQGTDELVELDARSIDPAMAARRAVRVGQGPTGLAIDPTSRLAVIWNQLSHDLSLVDLDSGSVETVPVASDPLPPEVSAGRRLFVTERDRRVSRDGRACAGCHPEGRDDGIVWKLGQGPRQTPTLVGRVERGPFGWLAHHATLEGNMGETMSRLGGAGLPEADLAALAAFVRRGLRAPRVPPAREPELVDRGKELFLSEAVGCAGCHRLDQEASDRAVHTVGSRAKADTTDGFRTPPLAFLAGTAPYFHDGRYATLEQLLVDNLDRMGQTSQLSSADRAALLAFLRTL